VTCPSHTVAVGRDRSPGHRSGAWTWGGRRHGLNEKAMLAAMGLEEEPMLTETQPDTSVPQWIPGLRLAPCRL
jgi:hypothetical protein